MQGRCNYLMSTSSLSSNRFLFFQVLYQLGHMLHQPSYMNGGWETVAEDLGFTHDQIRTYCTIASVQQHKTPGELMLRDWVDHGPGCTLFVLCNTLENVGRQDCLDYLRNEIYSKLKAYKFLKSVY